MSARSVGTLTLIRLLAAVAAVGYAIVQVQCFGTGREIEAFFAGTGIFAMILSLSQSGQLSEVFLPEYHRLKKQYGLAVASRAFSVVLNWLSIAIGGLGILAFMLSPLIISICYPGFEAADRANAVLVFRTCCLLLNVEIAGAIIKTVLNAESSYGRPEFVGLVASILSILILIFGATRLGIWALVLAFASGKLVSFAYITCALRRLGIRYSPTLTEEEFDQISFFKTLASTIGYAFSTQVYSVVLNASLSLMPQGVFAIFRYVLNLYAKLRGSVLAPMTTVFFTNFSTSMQTRQSTEGEDQRTHGIEDAIAYNFAAAGILWILVFWFGGLGLGVLWGGEKFAKEDVNFAWAILSINCVGLVVASLGGVFRKVVVGSGRAKTGYLFWSFAQILTACCVYFLFKFAGANGARFVVLINAILLALTSWIVVFRFERKLAFAVNLVGIGRTIICLVATFPVAGALYHGIQNFHTDASRFATAFVLMMASGFTAIIFCSASWLADVPGVRDVTGRIFNRLHSMSGSFRLN